MTRYSDRFAFVFVAVVAIPGCYSGTVLEEHAATDADTEERGLETLHPLQLTRIKRSDAQLRERARRVASLVAGVRPEALEVPDIRADKKEWIRPFASFPTIAVWYDAKYDDLLVLSESAFDSVPKFVDDIHAGLAEGDDSLLLQYSGRRDSGIGADAARRRLARAVQELGNLGVINDREYAPGEAHRGDQITGMGNDEATVEWVEEFGFYLDRKVDGVGIREAGIRIGIGREGEVSSVRIADVQVEPVSAASYPPKYRRVDDEAAEAALRADLPPSAIDVSIQRRRLAYVLREDIERAVVYPEYVFEFSEISKAQGMTLGSRRHARAYTVVDAVSRGEELGPLATAEE